MPPKRAAAAGPSRAQKSQAALTALPAPRIPRRTRWAAVSGSANADADYKKAMQNPLVAYQFVCMCGPPFSNNGEDDDDDDDDDEDENKCDGGDTCLCDKPGAEHPDHVWKLTAAGKLKFFTQQIHCRLRCPDYFGMYTFNDHEGYGILEVLQNLILDFEEAVGNYKEQWAVCECLALFLATDIAGVVTHIDDGDGVDATYELIGRLFMSMLAQLERKQLLSKDSEIMNLGLIMALFMDFARGARAYGLLESSKQEPLGQTKNKKKWEPQSFDSQILAYARKYDIDLVGPYNIDEIIADVDAEVDLPAEVSSTSKADPFGFARSLERYKIEHGGTTSFLAGNGTLLTPIGGDNLDITTWSSAKRKSKAFDKKDPLGKEEIDALKKGLVLTVG